MNFFKDEPANDTAPSADARAFSANWHVNWICRIYDTISTRHQNVSKAIDTRRTNGALWGWTQGNGLGTSTVLSLNASSPNPSPNPSPPQLLKAEAQSGTTKSHRFREVTGVIMFYCGPARPVISNTNGNSPNNTIRLNANDFEANKWNFKRKINRLDGVKSLQDQVKFLPFR